MCKIADHCELLRLPVPVEIKLNTLAGIIQLFPALSIISVEKLRSGILCSADWGQSCNIAILSSGHKVMHQLPGAVEGDAVLLVEGERVVGWFDFDVGADAFAAEVGHCF
jgi:hypothetical protein